MAEAFQQEHPVRWSDLDPNNHMRHSAYADLCAATRISYLEALGFGMMEFAKAKMGPVLFSENLQYFKEVRPNETLIVNVKLAAASASGHKWIMRHELIRKSDGKTAAQVDVSGAWLDLVQRKITPPPEALYAKIDSIVKTDDFKEL